MAVAHHPPPLPFARVQVNRHKPCGPNTNDLYINKNIGLIIPNSDKIRSKCSIFHVFLLIKNEMKEKKHQNYTNKGRWNAVAEALAYNNIPFNKIHWLIWLIKEVLKLNKN